ncbi:hypothetical protein IWX90DRAFT_423300 [Phyllosticta citrichinensis]|uniref:Uncharacterized protein n=1 Tax=Phyllosticta citrichinensis TaxID=1130410 RepID=A0ABR1Y1S4_9PEZI
MNEWMPHRRCPLFVVSFPTSNSYLLSVCRSVCRSVCLSLCLSVLLARDELSELSPLFQTLPTHPCPPHPVPLASPDTHPSRSPFRVGCWSLSTRPHHTGTNRTTPSRPSHARFLNEHLVISPPIFSPPHTLTSLPIFRSNRRRWNCDAPLQPLLRSPHELPDFLTRN